ncbi:MAG: hypothetical protein ACLQDY_11010 [Streptosporangiaceae bacterium]
MDQVNVQASNVSYSYHCMPCRVIGREVGPDYPYKQSDVYNKDGMLNRAFLRKKGLIDHSRTWAPSPA